MHETFDIQPGRGILRCNIFYSRRLCEFSKLACLQMNLGLVGGYGTRNTPPVAKGKQTPLVFSAQQCDLISL